MVICGNSSDRMTAGKGKIWSGLLETIGRVTSLRGVGYASIRAIALATTGLLINGTLIQLSAAQIPPPEYSLQDENHVDLVSFSLFYQLTDLSIGSKEHPLTHTLFSGPLPDTLLGNGYFRDSSYGLLNVPPANGDNCPNRNIIFGNVTEYFTCTKLAPVYAFGLTGSTLLGTTYTQRDGTIITYLPLSVGVTSSSPQKIQYPDGRVLTYGYCASGLAAGLLCSVTRSDGLQLKYNYTTLPGGNLAYGNIVAINNAYEYCNPTASTCSLSNPWPTVTYTWSGQAPNVGFASILTVTDPAGLQTRYTQDAKGRTIGIKLPSSTIDNFTYSYCDSSSNWCSKFVSPYNNSYENYVQSVIRDGNTQKTWIYTGQPGAGSPQTGTCGLGVYSVANPAGGLETVDQDYCFPAANGICGCSRPGYTSFMQLTALDGTIYSSGASLQTPLPDLGGRVYQVSKPEGNLINYTWDTRGNLTQEQMVPKPGSSQSSYSLSANYDATCTNMLTCNKPHWVKDGNGNETDYTYDAANGELLTVMRPPDENNVRPQTNYTYTQQSAYVLSSSAGQYVASPPIWVRSTESYCRTSAATTDSSTGQVDCAAGTSDKVLKTYYYGPNSGPNNLFLRGVQEQAIGSKGTLETHVTCYGYGSVGHQVSVTTPNAGLGLSSCDQFTQN